MDVAERVTNCVRSIPHYTEPLVLRIINEVRSLSLSNRKAFQPNSIDFTSGRSAPYTWAMNELSSTTLIQSRNDCSPNVADCNRCRSLCDTLKQKPTFKHRIDTTTERLHTKLADCNLDKPLDNTPKHDQLANTAILPVLKA